MSPMIARDTCPIPAAAAAADRPAAGEAGGGESNPSTSLPLILIRWRLLRAIAAAADRAAIGEEGV